MPAGNALHNYGINVPNSKSPINFFVIHWCSSVVLYYRDFSNGNTFGTTPYLCKPPPTHLQHPPKMHLRICVSSVGEGYLSSRPPDLALSYRCAGSGCVAILQRRCHH